MLGFYDPRLRLTRGNEYFGDKEGIEAALLWVQKYHCSRNKHLSGTTYTLQVPWELILWVEV